MNFRCFYCGAINSPTELACRQCGCALELGRGTQSLIDRPGEYAAESNPRERNQPQLVEAAEASSDLFTSPERTMSGEAVPES